MNKPGPAPAFFCPTHSIGAAAFAIAAFAAAASGDLGFTSQVTPGLVASYSRQFGSAVLDQLAALGFDGFQGYAGDRPAPV